MHAAAFIVSAWLAADLVTGTVHWWEDRYGNPAWPLLGKHVIAPNILHHQEPRAMLAGSYWTRNWTTIVPAAIVAAIAAACGQRWLALVAAFASQANEVHGWAHQRCNRIVRGLQLLGVVCSPEGHGRHHRSPFATDFCVMSDALNPLLARIGFWGGCEWWLGMVFGVWPRDDRRQA